MNWRVGSSRLIMVWSLIMVFIAVAVSIGSTRAIFSDSEGLHVHLQAGTWACVHSEGFWTNHPDDWPLEEIAIGGVVYSKDGAIGILLTPPRGDATIIVAHQLIAAMLNVAEGAASGDIEPTIKGADAWLSINPVGSDPSDPERETGIALATLLDDYNNGLSGPVGCEDDVDNPGPRKLKICTYIAEDWKDAPYLWPVEAITIGGSTYTKAEAIDILRELPKGDVTYILAKQLIATVLNKLNGTDASVVETEVIEANKWLEDHSLGSNPDGEDMEVGVALAKLLEDYNTGAIGPGRCRVGEITPTPTSGSKMLPSVTPTMTETPTPTYTPTSTATDTPLPAATSTFTVAPSDTPTPTYTLTSTATGTPAPTDTPTATSTDTLMPTDTNTPTSTDTPLPTETTTPTGTETTQAISG